MLIDYQEHAIYPVDIARARGISYATVRAWIYGQRRNTPVDHYEETKEKDHDGPST